MKKKLEFQTQIKIIFWIMLIILVCILIPLFWISHYNFPSVDDYSYAKDAVAAWSKNHSLTELLSSQFFYVIDCYQNWQGTYFSYFGCTCLLALFGENAYFVGTYLSLGGFVFAQVFFIIVALRKIFNADFYSAGIIAFCCVSMQVLFTTVPCEAFYWMVGSFLYTFSHALGLLLCSLWILLYYTDCTSKKLKGCLYLLGILILSFSIAGENYITALTIGILYVFCLIKFFWSKHPQKYIILVGMIVYYIFFMINVTAPGNFIRLHSAGMENFSAIKSIFLSLKEAADYIATWTILPFIILAIMLVPLFIQVVRKKNYQYPLPLLVSLISFGVFAAQFTPTIYTLGITGAGRVQNLYRFNLFLLLYGNELYWTGWFYRKWNMSFQGQEKSVEKKHYFLAGWIIGGILLCYSLKMWGNNTLTTVSAIDSLRHGYAKQYYAEHQERLLLLKDESIKDVYLKPYTFKPYLLFFGDITDDPQDWVNQALADYYNKASVTLIK